MTHCDYNSEHPEYTYMRLVRDVLDRGEHRDTRTNTRTNTTLPVLSLFGTQSRYDISDGIVPLLTTKHIFIKKIIEELLLFTGTNDVSNRDAMLWDDDHHRERESEEDFDHRLRNLIQHIKTNQHHSLILCAWNAQLQFYVHGTSDNKLSCHLYQHSGDLGLGVPFSIASYAILTHMIAHVTGLQATELVHTMGDAYIFIKNVEALEEQLKKIPDPFPKLSFKRHMTDIDQFTYEDFENFH